MKQTMVHWKYNKPVEVSCACGHRGDVASWGLYICDGCGQVYVLRPDRGWTTAGRAYTPAVQEVMRCQIIEWDEIKGDLVKFTAWNILVFSDGRWAQVVGNVDRDGYTDIDISTGGDNLWELYKSGLISEEEYRAETQAAKEAEKRRKEERELREYKRLAEKYG